MRRKALFCITVAFALAALPAAAGDILHFANGTSMPVESFTVEDDIIEVELGGGSTMAFPLAQIDRIERLGKEVFNSATPNQMIETPNAPARSRRDNEVSGLWSRKYVKGQSEQKPEVKSDPHIVVDSRTGLTGYRPLATSSHPAKAGVTATAHLGMTGAGDPNDPSGETRLGSTPFGRGGRIGARAATGLKPMIYPIARKETDVPPAPQAGDSSESE